MMFENQVLRQTVRWADCPALDFLLLLTTLNLAALRFVARQKKIRSKSTALFVSFSKKNKKSVIYFTTVIRKIRGQKKDNRSYKLDCSALSCRT